MLKVLRRGHRAAQVEQVADGWLPDPDVLWLDLLKPTREEELAVEAALGLQLPTVEEMQALEPSSRLYQECGGTFMTATLLARSQEDQPFATPVTFVLAKGMLVTLRYEELRAFSVFAERAPDNDHQSGTAALLGLMDAIIERLAKILDDTGDKVEQASGAIFKRPQGGNFRPLLTDLAQAQSVTALTRGSLVSLARTLGYASLATEITDDPECRAHLKTLQRDVQSLTEHASHQSSHIAFLLDAALGLINIEQNGIIKFFSVVAVVFMPPTLIASIYGMNFDVLPELHWKAGYPMALLAMLVAAALPVLWFKKRGWL
ncbi:MAG: magnesium transporter CorA family protein [Alphaproteobacteria bacterium]|nr:magnesium transporter CorA family protein [Alphaproteobacteria bacterium]MBU1514217.1 magnesium transporter CorA family protein [Alphaproteobacteria bacterium]MBU2095883.1 magnesium transporter CorA family protein [Alphaproteobacteria bacterium]MBU2151633.1 magnesium transporter CorA family protein [Alphaproteobacteria bacterium]MBU2307119.1 magnesium transporter CorA family protein [Alphaproteobacteria bacterium]